MFDRRIDVPVRVLTKQFPQSSIWFESFRVFFLSRIKNKGNNSVFADVLGDIFLSVVGAHLLLVDVFFKNITHHIRINFVVRTQGAFIQMPPVLIEKSKKFFKGFVRNIDVRILFLKLVDLEKTTI